jgi:MoxR-like ATPase
MCSVNQQALLCVKSILMAVGGAMGSFDRFALDDVQLAFRDLKNSIGQFIQGMEEAVRMALVCLFAEGHLLIEGEPGVAKTSLAKAIAAAIGGDGPDGRAAWGTEVDGWPGERGDGTARAIMRRIQFTSDLMPSDVTGGLVYDQESGRLLFRKGAVFCHVLLADEINRAAPKAQSALLEVMEERQVTVDGEAHEVPEPFLCIATRNPREHLGTYPLPDAQLDRFMMMVRIDYPSAEEEKRIIGVGLRREQPQQAIGDPTISIRELRRLMLRVRGIPVSAQAQQYIVDIAAWTRRDKRMIELGLSPRGSIALARAAQAYAAVQDPGSREQYAERGAAVFVAADDVKRVAPAVLAHRLRLGLGGLETWGTIEAAIGAALHSDRGVPVPREPAVPWAR